MNISEMSEGWPIREIVKVMGRGLSMHLSYILMNLVSISVVVISVSLFLAFSDFVRASLSITFNFAWTWLIVNTSIYNAFHAVSGLGRNPGRSLKLFERQTISRMKLQRMRDELESRVMEAEGTAMELEERERPKQQSEWRKEGAMLPRQKCAAERPRKHREWRKEGERLRNLKLISRQRTRDLEMTGAG